LKLESPSRLVLDVKDVVSRLDRVPMKDEDLFVKKILIGKHPDKVRFVFYPKGSQVPSYQVERKKDRLVVSFGTSSKIPNVEGAVKRLRPKVMTVGVMFMGLIPIMWATGAGADVMKRIAAPLIGGIFTSFTMELGVYPAIYAIWKWNFGLKKQLAGGTIAGGASGI
jgi:hypothetical protein